MSYFELHEFIEQQEMTTILSAVICGECQADDCDDCPGHDALSEVDDQICAEGLEFMKKLGKEWVEAQREEAVKQ